jgi:hypothetical protein
VPEHEWHQKPAPQPPFAQTPVLGHWHWHHAGGAAVL